MNETIKTLHAEILMQKINNGLVRNFKQLKKQSPEELKGSVKSLCLGFLNKQLPDVEFDVKASNGPAPNEISIEVSEVRRRVTFMGNINLDWLPILRSEK